MNPLDSIRSELPRGRLLAWLVVACLFRTLLPLAALAASGHALPAQPRYDFEPTPGDAQGFYSAARDLMAAWGRLGFVLPLVGLGVVAAGFAVWKLHRRGRTDLAIVTGALAVSLAVTAAITQTSHDTGSAVIGWAFVWSAPMLPYRALGGPLDPNIAFGFGLAITLCALVVTTVATWLIAVRATGSRAVAALAVGVFAFWPLLTRPLAGPGAWQNGTWHVDVGLHLYDEPLSTALVATAVVLLLAPRLEPVALASAGVLLSYATAVRLSNGLLAALALLLVARRIGRRALPFLLGLLTFAPVVIAWWPRGYAALKDRPDVWPRHPFALSHVPHAWSDSLLYTPRLLAILIPLGVVGILVLRSGYVRSLLGGIVLVSAVFYSFYAVTPLHPRFLYVTFPALFTLCSAGAVAIVQRARTYTTQSPRSSRR